MKFCPECGARLQNEPFCPVCRIDLARYLPAVEEGEERTLSPRERRERILADFEVKDHAIVRYLGKGGRVIVPEGINAVRENAFYKCGVIEEVIFPASIREIGEKAFYDCTALERVEFPEDLEVIGKQAFEGSALSGTIKLPQKVKAIGAAAFEGCFALERVILPDSVKTIGRRAFSSCGNLRAVEVDGDCEEYASEEGVLFDKRKETLLCYPAGKEGSGYRVPASCKSVGPSAFYDNGHLETVTLGKKVTKLFPNAFVMARSLKKIKISPFNPAYADEKGILFDKKKTTLLFYPPAREETEWELPFPVESIADNAIVGAKNLRLVVLRGNLKTLGINPFYDCEKLAAVLVDRENPVFSSEEGVLFNKEGNVLVCYPAGREKTYYEIPSRVKGIANTAFAFSQNLSGVILPEGIESVGEHAFYRCDALAYAYVSSKELKKYEAVFPASCVVTDK